MNSIEPICSYCKKDVGADPRNEHLANGFWDGDMKIFVCWKCRSKHYRAKNKTWFANLYTEFPVPINQQVKE